ncbi:MAG: peptidoglycan DD-metalloendopeptidase family protein [Bacteroidetes bacterium]|nr:peptidase M23 [Bacteroidota bacterium]MBV6461700.1 Murein hydrolase activator EnvC [Flavobacteriales bacterium]WKZ75103.1 MAG: peptidoglycan DD-metalloendopeptidase family protein [Vicingaceae bacterium]MCL4815484.1 peptidoglycan DD-metalloendopeptidase family protein [Flavobacteriales bacterium]NOG96078.1 peptidoglycan DD-metalloendopeptidase family protein [Bacteroidota bacterium]
MSLLKLNSFLLLFVFISFWASAQTKAELEKKKKQLLNDISYTNKLLKENEEKTKNSFTELNLIKKKINDRQELIYTISSEIKYIDKQIQKNNDIILSLKNDLTKLKQDYAHMIYYAYRNKSFYSRIMFVFAAKDFNQAYKRMKYLQQYAEFRKKQAESIIKTQETISKKIEELDQKKQEQVSLKESNEQEKKQLGSEQEQQQVIISKLQNQENELKEQLKKKQKDADALQKAIEEIIRKEIEAAQKAAQKAGNTNSVNKGGFPLTPEAQKLSNTFAANKGKLPWPVAEGVITGVFGTHEHAVLKGIMVDNNGIDISTKKGTQVRSVFEGEVSSVIIIPGAGKCVMIRHGEYLSVYSYLSEVFVKKGDKVSTKQILGIPATEENASKSEVHLEIWKATTKLNPEYWIYK